MSPVLTSPRLLTCGLALALAASLLTGCAVSRTGTPGMPGQPGSGSTASGEDAQPPAVFGDWTFIAIRGSHVVNGTFEIGDEESRIDMPGFTTDSLVREGSVAVRNDSMRWEGTLSTVMGPSRFVIGGIREGDEMTGFAEIAAAGTYQFQATRTR